MRERERRRRRRNRRNNDTNREREKEEEVVEVSNFQQWPQGVTLHFFLIFNFF